MRTLWVTVGLVILAVVGLGWWVLRGEVDGGQDVRVAAVGLRPQGGTFTLAGPEPVTLNPFTTRGLLARRGILRYTHDSLMERDPDGGSLRPGLAESVAVEDGGRRLVFTIRPGARFADGQPVTAADLLFGFQLKDQPGLVLGAFGAVARRLRSARMLDPRRLELVLDPVTFTGLPAVATGYVVGQRGFFDRAVADLARDAGEAVPTLGSPGYGPLFAAVRRPGPGTGPYRLAAWREGRECLLRRQSHSWARTTRPGTWNLDELRIRFVVDSTAQFVLLRQGGLDLYQGTDARALVRAHPELESRFTALRYSHDGLGLFAVVWNHRRQPLGDPRVRRALGALFDRDAMCESAFAGDAAPAWNWLRSPAPPSLTAAEPDPNHTRRLLASAGGEDLQFELLFAAGVDRQRQMVEWMRPSLRAAGVGFIAQPLAWSALVGRLEQRDFDAVLLYVSQGPDHDPFDWFHSSQDKASNYAGYQSAAADGLLEAARRELDPDRRAVHLRAFARLFARDEPVTVLLRPLSSVLLHRRFRGAEPGRLGLFPERWWVEKD